MSNAKDFLDKTLGEARAEDAEPETPYLSSAPRSIKFYDINDLYVVSRTKNKFELIVKANGKVIYKGYELAQRLVEGGYTAIQVGKVRNLNLDTETKELIADAAYQVLGFHKLDKRMWKDYSTPGY